MLVHSKLVRWTREPKIEAHSKKLEDSKQVRSKLEHLTQVHSKRQGH